MALKPEYLPLIKILEKQLFAISDQQRAYSWKTQQRKELFQDIEKVLYASDSNRHHFIATIVCLQTNQTEEIGTDELERLDIVDGQQRLTTLIILLKLIAIFLEKSGGELEKAEEDKLNELIVKDNPVEYASYVEFGHRQQPGRYVPALGKQLKQGWVKGRFMLTISEGEIQDIAPKVIEAKLKKWLKNGLS